MVMCITMELRCNICCECFPAMAMKSGGVRQQHWRAGAPKIMEGQSDSIDRWDECCVVAGDVSLCGHLFVRFQ